MRGRLVSTINARAVCCTALNHEFRPSGRDVRGFAPGVRVRAGRSEVQLHYASDVPHGGGGTEPVGFLRVTLCGVAGFENSARSSCRVAGSLVCPQGGPSGKPPTRTTHLTTRTGSRDRGPELSGVRCPASGVGRGGGSLEPGAGSHRSGIGGTQVDRSWYVIWECAAVFPAAARSDPSRR